MAELFYILYTLLYLVLLGYNGWVYRQTCRLTSILIAFNAIGLFWENGVIAAGRFMGASSLLQVLNMGRYCLHFALVPPLIWVLVEQLWLAGHSWAGTRLAQRLSILASLSLIIFSFASGARGFFQRLEPVELGGMLRYYAPNPISALVAVAVMGTALLTGLVLWIKNSWPWLFLSALLAFAIEGGLRNFELLNLVAGNGAEVLFQMALLQTELLVTKRRK